MNECFVFTQNARNTVGGWLKCRGVFRPCFRYTKHTKPPSWPINNLCPASWLRVTARLVFAHGLLEVHPAFFTAYAHIPGLWYGI